MRYNTTKSMKNSMMTAAMNITAGPTHDCGMCSHSKTFSTMPVNVISSLLTRHFVVRLTKVYFTELEFADLEHLIFFERYLGIRIGYALSVESNRAL